MAIIILSPSGGSTGAGAVDLAPLTARVVAAETAVEANGASVTALAGRVSTIESSPGGVQRLIYSDGIPPPSEFEDGDEILAVDNARLVSLINAGGQGWNATSTASGGGVQATVDAILGDGAKTTFVINHGMSGDAVRSSVVRVSDGVELITPRPTQNKTGTATVVFAEPPADIATAADADKYLLVTFGEST